MIKIGIAQYQGIGPLSRGIRLFTRSQWSHTAIVIWPSVPYMDKFQLFEAWGFNGVVRVNGYALPTVLSANHHPGTLVDIFTMEVIRRDGQRMLEFLNSQVGKKYDWSLIVKFLIRKPATENGRWICSELAGEAFKTAGSPLQRMHPWKMAPEHCGISTIVKPAGQVWTV